MRRIAILLAAACALSSPAQTFNDLVERICLANPAFAAYAPKAEAEYLEALSEAALPNPEVEVETLFGKGDNKYTLGISQAFDWPGSYSARKDLAAMATDMTRSEQNAEMMEAKLATTISLLNIIAANKKISNYSRTLESYERLLDTYRREYAKGNVTIIDLNKLQIETADLQQALADERRNLAGEQAALQQQAGSLDIAALTSTLDEFPAFELRDASHYMEEWEARSTEKELLSKKQAWATQRRKVAELSTRPGFALGYRYSYEDATSYNGLSLGVSLPMWGGKARKKAAEAQLTAANLEMEAAEAAARASIKAYHDAAASLRSRIAEYSKALTTSDNAGLLGRAFEAGQITLTEYIQDMRYFIEAETRLYDLQCSYAATIATLDAKGW